MHFDGKMGAGWNDSSVWSVTSPLGGAWTNQTYGAARPFYANGIILALSAVVLLIFLKPPAKKPIAS
ncbi:MAG: hypothetical protein ACYC3H_06945 [Bellilinea sp.]